MAKILVDKSKFWDNSSAPLSPLAKLLEAKDECGRTAFIIVCQKMDYAVIGRYWVSGHEHCQHCQRPLGGNHCRLLDLLMMVNR